MTVGRIKGLVVAIGTTTQSNLAVTVGTGKAGIESYLLYLAPEQRLQVRAELIIIKGIFVHTARRYTKTASHATACGSKNSNCFSAFFTELTGSHSCQAPVITAEVGLAGEIILIGKFLYALRSIGQFIF
jgi:hypothetical protein